MSSQDTLLKLSQSGEAVVDFIINNNPSGVQSKMDALQLLPSDVPNPTYAQLKGAVMDLVRIGTESSQEVFQDVLGVDYVDERDGYTGGLRKQLEQGVYQGGGEGQRTPNPWLILLDGVFDVAESVFGFLSLQEQSEISANAADIAEAEAAQNTLFGIPKEIVVAMIAVIGIVALVAIVKPRK